jgi:hypothetical protein
MEEKEIIPMMVTKLGKSSLIIKEEKLTLVMNRLEGLKRKCMTLTKSMI